MNNEKTFIEIKVFQVKLDRLEQFEARRKVLKMTKIIKVMIVTALFVINLSTQTYAEDTKYLYGYKVGGSSNNWNISIDNSSNYAAHNLYNITPKIQNESLLTRVTTQQSDLY